MFVLVDLARDLTIEFAAKRARVLLILIAIALSTGSLVAAVGIASMAAQQIDAEIAASATDTLTVEVAKTPDNALGDIASAESADGVAAANRIFTEAAVENVAAISAVETVGLRLVIADDAGVERATMPGGLVALSAADGTPVEVVGATSGYLEAYGIGMSVSWMLDTKDSYPVAMVGKQAARELGLPLEATDYTGYQIVVDGQPRNVIGVLDTGPLGGRTVVVPYREALAAHNGDKQATMLVRTKPGAGPPVSRVVREAIEPARPDLLKVSTVVDLANLRTGVSTQLSRLAAAVGAILLVLTALLIANSMVVAVVARTAEIGLRRALGASQGDIALLFLADGGLTGFLGGFGGAAIGCSAVLAVAAVNDWGTYLQLWYLAAGPLIGVLVGVIASAYPAWQAARISPAEAVRVE